MTHDKSERKNLVKVLLIIIVIIFLCINIEDVDTTKQETLTNADEFVVHMIDVGQAESFLLTQGNKTALVDCGKLLTGKNVEKYLKKLGIIKIEYLIITHPHEDHMGGMFHILDNFEIGTIVFPKVDPTEIKRFWYKILMHKIQKGDYQVEYAQIGDIYNIQDATFEVIAVETDSGENINNYSIVSKVSFGEIDMIMTGDAEVEVEEKILKSGIDIDAEILKVGHHGSLTSSSEQFLDAISPDYALISCKKWNKYDHPVESTMRKLEERSVEVYRTDECGNVTITITSEDVKFDCDSGDYLSGSKLKERNPIWRVLFLTKG